MKKLLILLYVFAFSALLQAQNADEIVQKVITKLDMVNDYSVDAIINTDTDFLKAPKTTAKIYYKKPNKFKVESKSFAVLPKGGVNFLHDALSSGELNFKYVGRENKNGEELTKISAIPKSDSIQIKDAFIWIDESKSVVKHVEATFEDAGQFIINFAYGSELKYGLPDKIELSFNMKNFKRRNDRDNNAASGNIKGKITVNYSSYALNKGLSDELFKDEKK